MAILRIRDENGEVHGIRALKGDKGEAGAGVHVGSYVGNEIGTAGFRTVDLGGSAHAVFVFFQDNTAKRDLAGSATFGVPIYGGWATRDLPLIIGGETMILLDGNKLKVKGFSFSMNDENGEYLGMHTIHFNKEGVTYHYIAFVEEAAE